jgi:hypothetical protein
LINAHLYGPKYLMEMLGEDKQEYLKRKQRSLVQMYRNLIAAGMEEGEFAPADVKIAAFNVLAIIQYSGVWYSPRKGRKPTDVIETQVNAVMSLLGARPAQAKAPGPARRRLKAGGEGK